MPVDVRGVRGAGGAMTYDSWKAGDNIDNYQGGNAKAEARALAVLEAREAAACEPCWSSGVEAPMFGTWDGYRVCAACMTHLANQADRID